MQESWLITRTWNCSLFIIFCFYETSQYIMNVLRRFNKRYGKVFTFSVRRGYEEHLGKGTKETGVLGCGDGEGGGRVRVSVGFPRRHLSGGDDYSCFRRRHTSSLPQDTPPAPTHSLGAIATHNAPSLAFPSQPGQIALSDAIDP